MAYVRVHSSDSYDPILSSDFRRLIVIPIFEKKRARKGKRKQLEPTDRWTDRRTRNCYGTDAGWPFGCVCCVLSCVCVPFFFTIWSIPCVVCVLCLNVGRETDDFHYFRHHFPPCPTPPAPKPNK